MPDHATDHDVIDELITDHREASDLVGEIQRTSDPQQRRDLADQLTAELVRHSVAEEMYVYPVMRDHVPDGAAAVDHDTEEHKSLEVLLKKLEGQGPDSSEFSATIGEVARTLADHVADEENDQFPKLRAAVPAETLVALKEKVDVAKQVAPTRPHPASPNAELFHKLVGPGVGLVDRLRDKLSGRNA